MIRATDTTRRPATTHVGLAVAGLAIVASLSVGSLSDGGRHGRRDGGASPATGSELCYLIDLYHRAEPDSAARFRLHEEIEKQLPW